tara:strand:+ start:2611 stop:6450 length:3840 start_codon:yes stop_codon:yes gene_type:complete
MNLFNVNVSEWTSIEMPGDVGVGTFQGINMGEGEGEVFNSTILTITPDNSPDNISNLEEGQEYVVSANAFSVPTDPNVENTIIVNNTENSDGEIIGTSTSYSSVPNYLNGVDQGHIWRVGIYDTGVAGMPGNTVEVQVILSGNFVMPNEDYTIHLDLDGAAGIYTYEEPFISENVWSFILTNAIWPGQRPLLNTNAIRPDLLPNGTLRAWGSEDSINNISNGGAAMFQAEYTLDGYQEYLQYEAQGKQNPNAIANCTITPLTPSSEYNVLDGTWSMMADGVDNPFPRADLYSVKWKISANTGFTVDAGDFQIMGADHVFAPIKAMGFSQFQTVNGQQGYNWLTWNTGGSGGYSTFNGGMFNTSTEYYNSDGEWIQNIDDVWTAWDIYDLSLPTPYGLKGAKGTDPGVVAYGFFYFTDGEDNQGTHVDGDGNYSWNLEAVYSETPGTTWNGWWYDFQTDHENGMPTTITNSGAWHREPLFAGSTVVPDTVSPQTVFEPRIHNEENCDPLGISGMCPTYDSDVLINGDQIGEGGTGWPYDWPQGILEPNSPNWGDTISPDLDGYGPRAIYSLHTCNCFLDTQWPSQYIGKIPWQEQYYYTASELENDIFPTILWAGSEVGVDSSYPPQQVDYIDNEFIYGPEYYYEPPENYEFGAYVWHNPAHFAFVGDGSGWIPNNDGGYTRVALGPITYPGGSYTNITSSSPARPCYKNIKVYNENSYGYRAVLTAPGDVNMYGSQYQLSHLDGHPGDNQLGGQIGVFKKVFLSNTNPGADDNEVIVEAFVDGDAVRVFNGDSRATSSGGITDAPGLDPEEVDFPGADWYNAPAWIGLQINGDAKPVGSSMPPPPGVPIVSSFNMQIVDNTLDSNSGSITIEPRREISLKNTIQKEGFEDQKNIYSLFGNIRYDDNRPIATITFDATKDNDGKYTHYFPSKPKIYQNNTASRLGFDFIENVRLVFKEKYKNNKLVYNLFLNIKNQKADLQDIVVNVNYKQKVIKSRGKAITNINVGKTEISSIGENKRIMVYGTPGAKFILEVNAIIKQFDDGAQSWNVDGKAEETSRSKRSLLVKSLGNTSVEDGGQSGKILRGKIDKNGRSKIHFNIPPSSTEQSYEIEIIGDTNKDGSLTTINSNIADTYIITQYPTPNLILTASTAGNAFTITDHKGTTGGAGVNSVITYRGALNKTKKQLENSRRTKTLISFSYLLDLTDNTKVFQSAIPPNISHFKNSYKVSNGGTVFQVSKVSWTAINANTITLTGELSILKWGNKTVNLTLDLDQLITHNQ